MIQRRFRGVAASAAAVTLFAIFTHKFDGRLEFFGTEAAKASIEVAAGAAAAELPFHGEANSPKEPDGTDFQAAPVDVELEDCEGPSDKSGSAAQLPVVDLDGYHMHRAYDYDPLHDVYRFLNIRYAASVGGTNRFRPPQAPGVEPRSSLVRTGATNISCPQATPAWASGGNVQAIGQFLKNLQPSERRLSQVEGAAKPTNATGTNGHGNVSDDANATASSIPDLINSLNSFMGFVGRGSRPVTSDPYYANSEGTDKQNSDSNAASQAPDEEMEKVEREDCLFLDLYVSKKVFEQRATGGKLAPVIVYFFGGGFVMGDKTNVDPRGLLDRSRTVLQGLARQNQQSEAESAIVVVPNYRLGAFGLSDSKELRANKGVPNAFMQDQLFALDWVKRNVAHFGGDAESMYTGGNSAGGASIMFQATAKGDDGQLVSLPYKRAFLSSPGWQTEPEISSHEALWKRLLTSLAEKSGSKSPIDIEYVRQHVSEADFIKANQEIIAASPPGLFTYTPSAFSVGTMRPRSPTLAIDEGDYNHDVRFMISNVDNEGLLFALPYILQGQTLEQAIATEYPTLSMVNQQIITQMLYPPSNLNRIRDFVGDAAFYCRSFIARLAFDATRGATVSSPMAKPEANASLANDYGLLFSIQPNIATHGSDTAFYLFDKKAPVTPPTGFSASPITNPFAAQRFQDYILNFLLGGKPQTTPPSLPVPPQYFALERTLTRILPVTSSLVKDGTNPLSCLFLSTAGVL